MGMEAQLVMQSAADACADRLREEILTGVYEGSNAFVIDRVAARLGVSHTPVREAVRKLEAEGFLDYHRGKGVIVRGVNRGEFEELVNLRKAIEPIALRAAIACLDEKRAAAAKASFEQWTRTSSARESMDSHRRFLQSIYATSGLVRTLEAIEKNWRLITRFHVFFWRVDAGVRKTETALNRALLERYVSADVEGSVAAFHTLTDWGADLVREKLAA
jgi:DNA-binding GntR family transcriptional regulator